MYVTLLRVDKKVAQGAEEGARRGTGERRRLGTKRGRQAGWLEKGATRLLRAAALRHEDQAALQHKPRVRGQPGGGAAGRSSGRVRAGERGRERNRNRGSGRERGRRVFKFRCSGVSAIPSFPLLSLRSSGAASGGFPLTTPQPHRGAAGPLLWLVCQWREGRAYPHESQLLPLALGAFFFFRAAFAAPAGCAASTPGWAPGPGISSTSTTASGTWWTASTRGGGARSPL